MMNKIKLLLTAVLFSSLIVAQEKADTLKLNHTPTPASFSFSNGIGMVAPDSLFSINFRFRTQLRSAYTTISENDFSASEIEARVRRLRLRMEGFVVNPKLNYYIQLSFSRGDMDWTDNDNSAINSSPNIVRDAVFIYKPNQKLSIVFGQTKLPGNRQRVVSSGELQFADRSIVNSVFTIDRDFGLQFAYLNNVSKLHYALKGAISSGEGRNSNVSDGGLAYTGRAELLPFGKFTNKGDYFEGDIEREQKPKVSIAAGYHYNEEQKEQREL
jgi:phosphate-selective porin OprO/OprP